MICPPQTNTRMTILSRQYNLTFKQLLRKIYQREYSRAYYHEHKEYYKELAKKWRKANPEKYKVTHKKWRDANPEKVKESHKKWLASQNEYGKQYYETNKHKITKEVKDKTVQQVKVYREKLREEKPKYNCPCGACILDWGYTVKNHEKTKKHQKWLASQK